MLFLPLPSVLRPPCVVLIEGESGQRQAVREAPLQFLLLAHVLPLPPLLCYESHYCRARRFRATLHGGARARLLRRRC